MPTEFKIKSDNPWDTLLLAIGTELKIGERVYNGARTMLINGVESQVAEPVYSGEYPLDNGKIVCIIEGTITEIKDAPGIIAEAKLRKEKYKK